jgi:ABC-type nitrate/sulfonate/bicarbonate transport system ATPase subunit/ABC-type nitrate/sulfonate/bicarbonate transport system permease component
MTKRTQNGLIQAVIIIGLLLLWEYWVRQSFNSLIPAPSKCFIALYELFSKSIMLPDLAASLNRVLVGFSIALAVGVILGFLLGLLPSLKHAFVGVLELLRPIPPIAWIPIAVSLLGIGDVSAWFVIFIGAFFPILTNTLLGVSNVEKVHLEAAEVLGASKFRSFAGVVLPSTLPSIFAGIRVGLGFAWMCVVAAEMFAARSGLGYAIQLNRQLFRLDRVVAYMIVIAVVGFLMARLVSLLERLATPWRRDYIAKDYYENTSNLNKTLPNLHNTKISKNEETEIESVNWKPITGASIVAKNIQFHYENSTGLILNGANIDVKKGEIFCILGLSGCGKSTLLRLIAGLEKRYSGIIQIDGEKLDGYRKDTTMVFQDFSLFPWRKVKGNVQFAIEQQKNKISDFEIETKQMLQIVGLYHKSNDYPYSLSGGQMQRVAFARALASKPRLMLLDEPFGALDIYTREVLQEEISEIFRRSGITVIMVTHDISEAIFMADRIAVMAPNGGNFTKEYAISAPRPRGRTFRNSKEFREIADILWKQINSKNLTQMED